MIIELRLASSRELKRSQTNILILNHLQNPVWQEDKLIIIGATVSFFLAQRFQSL